MSKKISFGYIMIIIVLMIYTLLCFVPMLLVISVSLSTSNALAHDGIRLFPREVSFDAYRALVYGSTSLINSYSITLLTTIIGTLLAVLTSTMAAFTLNNPTFPYRRVFSLFFFFTMLFNGGMVPWYMINKRLGLYNNIWALIIPSLVFNPYNMFLVRNYMKALPIELMDAARIDGANEMGIAFRIYLPLSMPVIAAIAMFYGLGYWNSWWNCLMLTDDIELRTLQTLLLNIRSKLNALKLSNVAVSVKIPDEPLQNATTIATIGPIILLYPLLQRYFVKGMVIGAIKG